MSKAKKALVNISSSAVVAAKAIPAAFATRGASSEADGSSAPSGGAAALPIGARGRLIFIAALLALAAFLLPAALALATTVTERPLLFTFNGHDTTAGTFSSVGPLEIEQASGTVYVLDRGREVIDKFNSSGVAQPFSGSSSSLNTGFYLNSFSDLAVDNSSANPGRIYVMREYGPVKAFEPNGSSLWSLPVSGDICGVAVDATGHPWVGSYSERKALEFASTGSPPAQTGSVTVTAGSPCRLDVDSSGNVYINRYYGGVDKYVGGTLSSTIDSGTSQGVTVDQSSASGHVFTLHSDSFNEYDSSGTLLGSFGAGTISSGAGIAYDHASDRVYVADSGSNTVEVFGPAVSGPVPAVTSQAATAVGISKATFHGEINPEEVPNNYYFQWKKSSQSWGEAGSTTPQSITLPNSSWNPVSFAATGLAGGSTYNVRLVGENSTNHLKVNSTEQTFTTNKASLPPTATINQPSSVTTTTAHLSGEVNPEEDAGTTWNFQLSTEPGCSSGFTNLTSHVLGSEATSPVPVAEDLTGLVPSEHYCVRLRAANSALRNEVQQLVVDAGAGEYTLSFEGKATVPLHYNAPAWEVQWRLNQLSTINYSVNVSGGPGNVGGEHPYLIEFGGSLADTDVPQLVATSVSLSGGAASATVTVSTPAVPAAITAVKEFTTAPIAPDEAETAPAAPRLDTSARLNARVNPEGEVLTYRFEYSEDGGSSWQALPNETYSGENREQIVVAEQIENLKPATTYEYRFVGENPAGPASPPGGVKSFTTRTTAEVTLPPNALGEAEKRGDELVNSPDKGDQNVIGFGLAEQNSWTPDGEKFLWRVTAGSPGGYSATGDTYLAHRTASGWQSHTLLPPPAQQAGGGNWGYELHAATPDFSKFVFDTGPVEVFLGTEDVVRVDNEGHEEVLETGIYGHGVGPSHLVSDNGAHEVTANGKTGELEDLGTPGSPEVLSVMPDGTNAACYPEFLGGESYRAGYRWISNDASRVYFEANPNKSGGGCESSGPRGIYERNREAGTTTLIDPGSGSPETEMIRATPNGRSAYFLTTKSCRKWSQTGTLTCETAEPNDTNGDGDVYRFDEATGESTCLTCAVTNENGEPVTDAAVKLGYSGGAMVSDDFSHIYFNSAKRLVPGKGEASGSLYVLSGGIIRFVSPAAWLYSHEVRLSADGNVLVFTTRGSARIDKTLTSDATAKTCQGGPEENHTCEELYRYDDRDQSLECISCRRGGVTTHAWGGTFGPTRGAYGEFELSADGSTVVFVTAEALVPSDVNGGFDVYEWRNGVQRLITDGVTEFATDVFASPKAAGVDATGKNIFFMVSDPGLTGYEHDGLSNLYDARIGGGFPRPNPPAHCSEESCQGPLQAAPNRPAQNSATYSGAGNQTTAPPKRCAKGKVRRHGRCVTKRHKHRHARAAHAGHGRTK